MGTKVITKQIHDRLDLFVQRNNTTQNSMSSNDGVEMFDGQKVIENKKIIRKNDGLVEKMNKKIIISEDSRQLLNG